MKVKQELLHAHSKDGVQRAEGDLRVRLIDSQIAQKILGREIHFGNMYLALFRQMV